MTAAVVADRATWERQWQNARLADTDAAIGQAVAAYRVALAGRAACPIANPLQRDVDRARFARTVADALREWAAC